MKIAGADPVALAATLALGAAGGGLAVAAHLPLGWLLGSLLTVGILAAAGARVAGRGVVLPAKLRQAFVPVIGVSIGAAFTPEVVRQMPGWLPSLGALCLYLPVVHLVSYAIYRRGGIGRLEAFYGGAPGGLIEAVQLGEEAGADPRLLTVLQFLRLILTIVAVPLLFLALTGHAVGSAAGATLARPAGLGAADAAMLVAAGLAGLAVGRLVRLPAYIMTGPLAASALLHGLGLAEGAPPGWLVAATQVMLGAGLGARFAGIGRGALISAGRLAVLNALVALTLALAFAGALHWLVDEPVAAVFLAFAPGGLAEMSLIALSLNISVIYVTAHHVLRILLAVIAVRLAARWLR